MRLARLPVARHSSGDRAQKLTKPTGASVLPYSRAALGCSAEPRVSIADAGTIQHTQPHRIAPAKIFIFIMTPHSLIEAYPSQEDFRSRSAARAKLRKRKENSSIHWRRG